jgi:UDP-glucose:(heptosyl)LPS alpha-1,3-glucosyltransferase
MKVTICCKQLVESGGAEAFLANFARCLLADGHQVKVLTPRAGADTEGLRVTRLRLPRVPRSLADLALARASRTALAADDADVTFSDQKCWGAHVVRPGGGVQREYVRQRQKSYRGPWQRTLNRAFRALSLRERLRIYIDDKLYEPPGPRCIIANSDMVRRELVRHHPHLTDRIRVVYNGADLDRFSPTLKSSHRTSVRGELGIPQDALVGVFVGHDWRRKGLFTFLEALGILARRSAPYAPARDAYGIVVGRGDSRQAEAFAVEAGAAGRVRFVGPGRPDRYYGAADLSVLPSYYDPCANVTLEALACGLPVITSVFNGAFELLTPGLNGFYVRDASDSAQLAGFIEYYADGARLEAGSGAAQALALEHPLKGMYRDIMAAMTETAGRAAPPA